MKKSKNEIAMTNHLLSSSYFVQRLPFVIRYSDFVIHLDFGFRHSDFLRTSGFVIRAYKPLATCPVLLTICPNL